MHVLVTGGAGFIGSHLVDRLVGRGDRVTALDNFNDRYDPAIKRENAAALRGNLAYTLVEGDILTADLAALFAGVDAVVHLAALAGVRPSIEEPEAYIEVNVRGTQRVLDACTAAGVRRAVVASSSSVYGDNAKIPFSESDPVDHPVSPYAATKKATELVAYTAHHLTGLPVFCLRFFTVYGPRQRPEMAIHAFARRMVEGKSVPMFGDGTMERDYTFIDDIIEGCLRAVDRVEGYRVLNLGRGEPVPLQPMILTLARELGVEPRIERLPLQPGDVKRTWADIGLAREVLGYRPSTPFEEGIRRFVAWFRSRG